MNFNTKSGFSQYARYCHDDREPICYVYRCGQVVDATMLSCGCKHGSSVIKVDADHYINLSDGTGEILEFMRDGEGRDRDGLRRIFIRLRQIINANFSGGERELFVTLTYAENMQDKDQLYKDFDVFLHKLKNYGRREESVYSYVSVYEPQGRGAWHVHMLLKSDKPLMIKNSVMRQLWGHGHVKVKRLESADNLGAYYVTYFTDTLSPGTEPASKRRKKSDRLRFYDDYDHIYSCSRDIVRPEAFKMPLSKVIEEFGDPTYFHETTITQTEEQEEKDKNPISVARMQFKKRK